MYILFFLGGIYYFMIFTMYYWNIKEGVLEFFKDLIPFRFWIAILVDLWDDKHNNHEHINNMD